MSKKQKVIIFAGLLGLSALMFLPRRSDAAELDSAPAAPPAPPAATPFSDALANLFGGMASLDDPENEMPAPTPIIKQPKQESPPKPPKKKKEPTRINNPAPTLLRPSKLRNRGFARYNIP